MALWLYIYDEASVHFQGVFGNGGGTGASTGYLLYRGAHGLQIDIRTPTRLWNVRGRLNINIWYPLFNFKSV